MKTSRYILVALSCGVVSLSSCLHGETPGMVQDVEAGLLRIQAEERTFADHLQEEGAFHVLAGSRSASLSKRQVRAGRLVLNVVTPQRGRVYVRYYERGAWKRKWTSFTGGTTLVYDFSSEVRYFYAYAFVYAGTVEMREGRMTPLPGTTVTTTTSAATVLSPAMKAKGVRLIGERKSEEGVGYYSTLRDGIAGRVYVDGTGKAQSYLENPLLTAYLQDGGIRKLGKPKRDQYTLREGGQRADYIVTARGSYLYSYVGRTGMYLPATTSSRYFSRYSSLGIPIGLTGNKLRTSKGMLNMRSGRATAHTDVGDPLRSMRLTQRFLGTSRYPTLHSGADYGAPTGTPVYAIANGTVVQTSTGYTSGWGNIVKIKHFARRKGGTSLFSIYGHLSRLLVADGQFVSRGDVIGLIGNTGDSSGPHLHLGVFDDRVSRFGIGYTVSSLPNLGYLDPQRVLARPEDYLE